MNLIIWFLVFSGLAKLADAVSLRHTQSAMQNEYAATGTASLSDLLDLSPAAGHAKKRPVLTVELMGGLGNQLFQVAALISTGLNLRPAFSLALPDVQGVCCNRSTYWDSLLQKLKPLLLEGLQPPGPTGGANASRPAAGRCLVEQVPGFDPYDEDCSDATAYNSSWASSLRSRASCGTVKLYGYFQHPAFFAPHLPILRQAFWDDNLGAKAKAHLAALLPDASHEHPVVSIHYRLGDYDRNGWVLDSDYYDAALLQVVRHLAPRRPSCLIFSDEPKRAWARSSALEGCVVKVLAKTEDTATNFHMMSLAQASVTADSTFSYWAALLGNKKEVIVTPRLEGPQKECWSYLQPVPDLPAGTSWLQVPTRTLSSQELFAQELMNMAPPSDD